MRKTTVAAVVGLMLGFGIALFAHPAEACSRDGCCKHCGSNSQPCGDSCIALGVWGLAEPRARIVFTV